MEGQTWVLVADCARGRLFQEDRHGLKELMGFCHMEGREHVKDRVRDRQGRRAGGGPGNPSTPGSDLRDVEARKFAAHMNTVLRKAHGDRRFDQLVVVAPPHFLGLFRQMLDKQVAHKVVATIDKDLTYLQARNLAGRIFSPRSH